MRGGDGRHLKGELVAVQKDESTGKGAYMAENRQPDKNREGYDPEFEIPDPEQVEKDRKEAEKIYGEGNEGRKNPAA